MSLTRQIVTLVVSVAACLGAGFVGSRFSIGSVHTWYPTLSKPTWTPPAWVFAPVWTALYCMMGIAAGLVWSRAGWAVARVSLILFAIQLVLNVTWSAIFFGLHQPGWAFAEIVLLWAAIAATAGEFWRVSKAAGWLMIPYLAWVTFASALNFAVWRLNR
jgi:translocator protein